MFSAINRDARIAAYKQKDEKDFEAEREELESNRLLGYEYVKAMNKQRAEFNMKQVGGRKMKRPRKLPMQLQSSEIAAFEFEDKEEKPNTLLEEALTPPKEMSSSRLYQQLIRELTGSMHQSKCTNKRGRGRGAAKYGVVSPNKVSSETDNNVNSYLANQLIFNVLYFIKNKSRPFLIFNLLFSRTQMLLVCVAGLAAVVTRCPASGEAQASSLLT